jgi:hypothetical protein
MNQKSIAYCKKFLIFYIVDLGIYIGIIFLSCSVPENALKVIFGFVWLFMLMIGLYAVSFIYGIFFQVKNRLEFSKILLLSGLLFLIGILVLSPVWLIFYSGGNNYGLTHLLEQASFQALCFFAGSLIAKLIIKSK